MPAWSMVSWLGRRWQAWRQGARYRREQVEHDRMRERALAENRALSLLLTLLNPEQCHEFQLYGHFHVRGGNSGERYRIRSNTAVNIDVLSNDGSVRYHLCARPMGPIPIYDVMAGQLLYLRDPSTEQSFLIRANKYETPLVGLLTT